MTTSTVLRVFPPLVCLAIAATGCGSTLSVRADPALALQRVVIYRNGVGYFERRGRVTQDHVEFRVRDAEVGDFLATLAVMEQGGSSVRSAAFPLPREEQPADASAASGSASPGAASGAASTSPPDHSNERRTVRLTLDGHEHDLAVGYMVETPIWRPSYRLVFDPQGSTVQVQAWGIVQNVSGEDWNDVRLSLVTGAPVAFRSELAVPVISPRPLVTDRGEVIDAVPQSETTLATEQESANAALIRPDGESVRAYQQGQQPAAARRPAATTGASAAVGEAVRRRAHSSRANGGGMAPDYYNADEPADDANATTTPPAPVSPVGPAMPRSLASLAAVAIQGGVTRYDLPNPVSVPNQSATMVLLAAREVPGRRMYLFAPDPGVGDSASHPFHVARFENRTGSTLERGPLAIFDRGSFLGEGLMDPLPDGATTTVPFALERGIAVEPSTSTAVEGARLLRISRGEITIERYRVERSRYRVRNGLDHDERVWVRQSVPSGMALFEPPRETETAEGSALVPVDVTAHAHNEVEVQVRAPFADSTDWSDEQAAAAIEAFLATGHPDAAIATALREALDLRAQLISLGARREDVNTRREDVSENADQTRESLEAIRRNPRAADLRARLTTRLGQLNTQLDTLTRQLVELDTEIGEKRVRLLEATRTIDLDATVPAGPASATSPAPANPPAPRGNAAGH